MAAGLRRALGPLDAPMVNVGVMIGSAVFLTASDVARAFPHPLLQLATWVVAGLFSLAGALTIAFALISPAETKTEIGLRVGADPDSWSFRSAWHELEKREAIEHVGGRWQAVPE